MHKPLILLIQCLLEGLVRKLNLTPFDIANGEYERTLDMYSEDRYRSRHVHGQSRASIDNYLAPEHREVRAGRYEALPPPHYAPPADKPPIPSGWFPHWDERYQHWY